MRVSGRASKVDLGGASAYIYILLFIYVNHFTLFSERVILVILDTLLGLVLNQSMWQQARPLFARGDWRLEPEGSHGS